MNNKIKKKNWKKTILLWINLLKWQEKWIWKLLKLLVILNLEIIKICINLIHAKNILAIIIKN